MKLDVIFFVITNIQFSNAVLSHPVRFLEFPANTLDGNDLGRIFVLVFVLN